MGLEKAIFSA